MNPDRLLAHFDRIAEAPDAVARLRRFILDLAVRGRLVEQDSDDQPVSKALRRIKALPLAIGAFPLPTSWEWINVGSVAEARLGKMLDKGKNRGTPRAYLRNVNVRWFDFDLSDLLEMPFEDAELSEFELRRGDVLICEGGEPGRAAVWDGRNQDIYFQKAIHRVRFALLVDPLFFVMALKASAEDGRLAELFTGTGIKHFTGRSLRAYRFPLPPVAEQHRIVAKVGELMALCDRLEAAQGERERRRGRLVAASLARISQPGPSLDGEAATTFREYARFHLDHLPRLTTRPKHIKSLRQAILNLAVRGKLVPQDPNDEPASKTLCGIEARRLSDGAFPLPALWAWIDVSCVAEARLGKMLDKGKNKGKPYPYLRNINVRWFDFDLADLLEMRFEDTELAEFELRGGDVLICEGGEPGRAAVWDQRTHGIYFQKAIHRVRFAPVVDPHFFVKALKASAEDGRLQESFTGTGIKHFTGRSLAAYKFPLPPLPEQHRIVAKVDELMAVCDQLEAQLVTGQTEGRRLLEAVLREALAPGAEEGLAA